MRKRIFRYLFLMALAMLTACFAVLVPVIYRESVILQEEKLNKTLHTAAIMAEGSGGAAFAAAAMPDFRLTLIASSGEVLFDSRHDPSDMDGHALRSEVRSAAETGFGRSVRYSDTLLEETAYLARRMPDGSVLRISESRSTAFRIAYDLLGWFVFAAVALIGIFLSVSRHIAGRIVAPVNSLDLENPLRNNAYDELVPMLRRLERQHVQISEHIASLKKQKDEFEHIVGAMEEGLVMLDTFGRILSTNRAAGLIFGLGSDCRGSFFRDVDPGDDIRSALERSMDEGRADLQIERKGRLYHLDMSRIMSGERIVGSVILACDITERAERERRRREFTADVSHELKTPLQSIIGASELMAGGLVRQEDMRCFASRIYDDGQRMAALIGDLLRLARLDEGVKISPVMFDLAHAAAKAAEPFREAAEEAGLKLTLECSEAPVMGDPALAGEIVGNLLENAIKYNRPGGSIHISTGLSDGHPFVTVRDTGIGIAEKDHERIFERFYCVDKSRSRRKGGTGLGLSIVKHAVQFHKAEIRLKSRLNEGTEITIVFPAAEKTHAQTQETASMRACPQIGESTNI